MDREGEKRITWMGVAVGVVATAVVAGVFVHPWSDEAMASGGGPTGVYAGVAALISLAFTAGCLLQMRYFHARVTRPTLRTP